MVELPGSCDVTEPLVVFSKKNISGADTTNNFKMCLSASLNKESCNNTTNKTCISCNPLQQIACSD